MPASSAADLSSSALGPIARDSAREGKCLGIWINAVRIPRLIGSAIAESTN